MKFGAYLKSNIYTLWEHEYIQYDKLKFYLKERQLSLTGWTQTDEKYFAENLVTTELDKVYQFIDLKLKNTESRIKEMQLLEFSNNFNTESQSLSKLLDFIEINSLGFQKIIKKHKKWTRSDLNKHIKICGCSQRFEIYKCRTNQLLYNINLDDSEKKKQQNGKNVTDSMKTTVTTFWVHPDNLSEVQATVLFNLPNVNADTSTQPFNSIFLDNPLKFNLYYDLVKREKNAELIQIEWQEGKNDPISSIELREQYESQADKIEYSKVDKFYLHQKHIKDYLGSPLKEEARKKIDLATPTTKNDSISALIQNRKLESIIRSRYRRFIYKSSTSSNLQITINTDVQFINDKKLREIYNLKTIDTIIEQHIDHSNKQHIQQFPFSIFEIKQHVNNNQTGLYHIPNWLSVLVNSGLIYEVPFFSPYLHGISCFYPDQVSLLPWWLNEMKNDIRKGNGISMEQPYICINTDNLTTKSIHYENTGRNGIHSIVNISNEQKYDYPMQLSKPDEIPNSLLPSFEYTQRNPRDNGIFSPFHSLENGIGFMNDNQKTDNKASIAAHEVLLENPIVSKIKSLKENSYINDYEEPCSKYEDIGMASWLIRRLRRRNSDSAHSSVHEISVKQGKPKRKLEPKVFFANERTFISWLQFSAFLLTVSLGLINFGDNISKFSGGFFIVMSVLLSVYALLRFQYRSWQIRMRNDTRFDDRWGPAVLCVVLVIALVINFGLRMNQPVPENPSLFGQQQDDMLTGGKMGGIVNIHNSNSTDRIIENGNTPNHGSVDQNEYKIDKKNRKKIEQKNESSDLPSTTPIKFGEKKKEDDDDDDDKNGDE